MKSQRLLMLVAGALGALAAFCQAPPAAPLRTGPGVQAPQDAKQPELLKTCKQFPLMPQCALLALAAAAELMQENGRPQGAELIRALIDEIKRG